MDAAHKKYDVKTVIRLIAPRELGVTLAPLSQIEEAEMFLFWSAIFFALFTSLLGALISLLCASYSNSPMMWLLFVFLLIFLGLFVVFGYLGFSRRKSIRRQALGSDTGSIDILKAKYSVLQHKAYLLRMYHDMASNIFLASDTIPWEDFRNGIGKMTSPESEELGDNLAALFVLQGLVKKVEEDAGQVKAVFDRAFDITKYEDTSWEDLLPSWGDEDTNGPTTESNATSD